MTHCEAALVLDLDPVAGSLRALLPEYCPYSCHHNNPPDLQQQYNGQLSYSSMHAVQKQVAFTFALAEDDRCIHYTV